MNRIKNNAKRFFTDEDGMEFVQWVIIIMVSIAVAAVIFLLRDKIVEIISEAIDELQRMWNGSKSSTGGTTSPTSAPAP